MSEAAPTTEDTAKAVHVDNHLILILDKDGSIKYGPPVEPIASYKMIEAAEKMIGNFIIDKNMDRASVESVKLFLSILSFEILRLRNEVDDLKKCLAK